MLTIRTLSTPSTSRTPESVVEFFNRYQRFKEQTNMQLWACTEEAYSGLIKRFVAERSIAMNAERLVASNYNLFSILKLNFSEVKLHTPILANLLNPTGSHGQGLTFFKYFVQTCLKGEKWQKFLDVDPHDLYVKDEKGTSGYGQIDILIHSRKRGNKFAIIIENKIGAGDQKDQLHRYYLYAKNELGLDDDRICVVYLKKVPSKPDGRRMEKKKLEELKNVLVMIGYHPHITRFLKTSYREIAAPAVRVTIKQYILTINYFRP